MFSPTFQLILLNIRVFRNQHHHLDDMDVANTGLRPAGGGGGIASLSGSRAINAAASRTSLASRDTGIFDGASTTQATDFATSGDPMGEGSRYIPCRARGMPTEHDYKVNNTLSRVIRSISFKKIEISKFVALFSLSLCLSVSLSTLAVVQIPFVLACVFCCNKGH